MRNILCAESLFAQIDIRNLLKWSRCLALHTDHAGSTHLSQFSQPRHNLESNLEKAAKRTYSTNQNLALADQELAR